MRFFHPSRSPRRWGGAAMDRVTHRSPYTRVCSKNPIEYLKKTNRARAMGHTHARARYVRKKNMRKKNMRKKKHAEQKHAEKHTQKHTKHGPRAHSSTTTDGGRTRGSDERTFGTSRPSDRSTDRPTDRPPARVGRSEMMMHDGSRAARRPSAHRVASSARAFFFVSSLRPRRSRRRPSSVGAAGSTSIHPSIHPSVG